MSDPAVRRSGRSPLASWLPILVLLAPAVILPLWVPLYDREDPTFIGFPFYYWFQFLLIVVAVVLTVAAYVLARRADRNDRVRHGLPAAPPAAGDGPVAGAHRREGGAR